jgi:hypothetical protein
MCSEFNVNRSDDWVRFRVQGTKPFQSTTLAVMSAAVTPATATNKRIVLTMGTCIP